MLEWLSTREADEFAKTVAADLAKRIPAAGLESSDPKALQKLLRAQNAVFSLVEGFARRRRLNLYQKASFGNTFKWALKEAGYPAAAVDAWTREVATCLASRSKDRP